MTENSREPARVWKNSKLVKVKKGLVDGEYVIIPGGPGYIWLEYVEYDGK